MSDRVTRAELLSALVDTLYDVKAYEIADECDRFGIPENPNTDDPFKSKRMYLRARLNKSDLPQMIEVAQRIVEDQDNEHLQELLTRLLARGVDGQLKNLIFAADGPKPRIVLRDAINNTVEIVEGGSRCLVFDQPLTPAGLMWGDLVAWWIRQQAAEPAFDQAARDLYLRLRRSLANAPERQLLEVYARRYAGPGGAQVPALIPQVYLHFDPYTARELEKLGRTPYLTRQRMDFLLLLPNSRRIVVEIDGKQHYSSSDGRASPTKYAEMVAEDRQLRLVGYEVFRFGGHEFSKPDTADQLARFFDALVP